MNRPLTPQELRGLAIEVAALKLGMNWPVEMKTKPDDYLNLLVSNYETNLSELETEAGYCENKACCSERGHRGKCDERAGI